MYICERGISGRVTGNARREHAPHQPYSEVIPTLFIPYSWDSPGHKQWVLELSTRLRSKSGINVILDQWNLTPGKDTTIFMETNVSRSDFVLLICTPKYAEKANKRDGGVGYEAMIITGELASKTDQDKFIPVLREEDWDRSLPIWIRTKRGVDLRGAIYSDAEYESLVRAIHRESLAPPIGADPIFASNANEMEQEQWDDTARLSKGMSIEGGTPLSGFRKGNAITISVGAFSARFHDRKSAIGYNSGSISFSGPPRRYYVFARDPHKEGGAVPYQITEKRGEAMIGDDVLYIGSIRI